MEHLTPTQLKNYHNDLLHKEEREKTRKHLLSCEKCRKLLPLPTKEQFLKAIFGDEEQINGKRR